MEATVSGSSGPVSVLHDCRIYKPGKFPDNIDEELSKDNIYFVTCQNARAAFNEFFQEDVDEYNEKQKRKDRQIKDYYKKIRQSKNGEVPIFEYVWQIGNRENTLLDNAIYIEILKEFAKRFQRNNPNFHVISSCLHVDEPGGTPHLHIAFIPYAIGYKQGMKKRCSISQALESMGYKGENRNMRAWKSAQEDIIEEMMYSCGIERVRYGSKRERVDVALYKEIKQKALADAQVEKEGLENDITQLKEEIEEARVELKEVKEEIVEKRSVLAEIKMHIDNNLSVIKKAVKGLFIAFNSAFKNSALVNINETENELKNAQKQAQEELKGINPTIKLFVEENAEEIAEEVSEMARRRRGR
jgi:hypothetical protein